KHTLNLTKVPDIASRIQRHFDIGAQAEADLIRLVLKIAGDDVMPAPAELRDETRSDGPESARYEYSQCVRLFHRSSLPTPGLSSQPCQTSGPAFDLRKPRFLRSQI